jgi:hypothetical protein
MNRFSIIIIIAFLLSLLSIALIADDSLNVNGDLVTDTTSSAMADTVSIAKPDSTPIPPPPDSAYIARSMDSSWWKRTLDNQAFNVGEYLEFGVSYGIIPAGTAVMSVEDTVRYDGIKCFKVTSIASTNGFVSTFYKVRDTVATYIDYDGIFPHYFWKKLHEGKYKTEKRTFFDQKRHLAITDNDTIPTYAFVQDAFSSLYYLRTQKLEPGTEVFIDNHTSKKNFPLKVVVHGRETVKVPAGTFDCLVIEPVMREQGIFQAKGSIKIWITDDQYKMPVKMQTEVFFLGSIHADLKSYKHGLIPE